MTAKWRKNTIAWADDTVYSDYLLQGVQIYDTNGQRRITFIDRPADSPRADLYRCRLCWKNDVTLLIGWADSIKIAVVKVVLINNKQSQPGVAPGQQSLYVEIVALYLFYLISRFQTDFIVSGIAPIGDLILLLGYVTETEDENQAKSHLPELRILDVSGDEVSADALTIKGAEFYQANDYVLG